MNRNYGLQLIRGVACIGIVAMHTLAYLENAYALEFGKELSFFGRYALLNMVDIFFALAGFLLTKSLLQNTELNKNSRRPLRFIGHRWLRLIPSYWLAISIAVIIQLVMTYSVYVGENFWLGLLLLPNGGYILNVEWTLVYDLMFYIVCSLFGSRSMQKFFIPFIIVWNIAIIVLMGIYHYNIEIMIKFPQILFSGKYFAYFVGCYAYMFYDKVSKSKLIEKLIGYRCKGYVFLTLLLIMYIINYEVFFAESWGGVVVNYLLVFMIIIVATFLPVFSSNLLVKFGNNSYGIYLIHAKLLYCILFLFAGWKIPLIMAGTFGFIMVLMISYGFGEFGNHLQNYVYQTIKTVSERKRKLCILFMAGLGCVFLGFWGYSKAAIYNELQRKAQLLVREENAVAGYVDTYTIDEVSNSVVFDGWAYDPIKNELVSSVFVKHKDRVIEGDLVWYDRSEVGEVLNNPVLTNCGFNIRLDDITVDDIEKLNFYIQINDRECMELVPLYKKSRDGFE